MRGAPQRRSPCRPIALCRLGAHRQFARQVVRHHRRGHVGAIAEPRDGRDVGHAVLALRFREHAFLTSSPVHGELSGARGCDLAGGVLALLELVPFLRPAQHPVAADIAIRQTDSALTSHIVAEGSHAAEFGGTPREGPTIAQGQGAYRVDQGIGVASRVRVDYHLQHEPVGYLQTRRIGFVQHLDDEVTLERRAEGRALGQLGGDGGQGGDVRGDQVPVRRRVQRLDAAGSGDPDPVTRAGGAGKGGCRAVVQGAVSVQHEIDGKTLPVRIERPNRVGAQRHPGHAAGIGRRSAIGIEGELHVATRALLRVVPDAVALEFEGN